MRSATMAVLSAVLAGATACSAGPPQGLSDRALAAHADIIRVDGSSTVYPITEAVVEEFQKATPGARVTVGISGTGGGFQKFCRGEIDISDSSRAIEPVEADSCEKAGIGFIELPIAYDGLAVLVNPKNTWTQSMTVVELRKLWSPEAQGRITRWSQIRTGWPDREIHLFGAGTDSGTYDYFTDAIVGKEGSSRGDFTSSEDDNVLVQGIATDELALGFFGYAYYEENQDKLKLVPIDDENDANGKGPIAPSPQTVRQGTYQPLARPVFIYVTRDAAERSEVRQFVEFYLARGPGLVREVGYVPLGDAGYRLALDRFRTRTQGSIFRDTSRIGVTIEDLLAGEK